MTRRVIHELQTRWSYSALAMEILQSCTEPSIYASEETNPSFHLTVFHDTDRRSAFLAFVSGIHRWLVDSEHNGPVIQSVDDFFVATLYIAFGQTVMWPIEWNARRSYDVILIMVRVLSIPVCRVWCCRLVPSVFRLKWNHNNSKRAVSLYLVLLYPSQDVYHHF